MTGYYDVILGVIPLTLAGVTGTLTLAGVGVSLSVTIAALVAIGFIGHALFVRAPTSENSTRKHPPTSPSSSRTHSPPLNGD